MPKTASWIIVRKGTMEAIAETFLPHVAAAINTEKYTALPAKEYLARLNQPKHSPPLFAPIQAELGL